MPVFLYYLHPMFSLRNLDLSIENLQYIFCKLTHFMPLASFDTP